jgi:hypothetical protein
LLQADGGGSRLLWRILLGPMVAPEARKLMVELNEIARHRYVTPYLFVNSYLGRLTKDGQWFFSEGNFHPGSLTF